jgi:hypothetical protein
MMKAILLLNSALLAIFFAAWCGLDYSLVKSPQFPQNCHDYDWTLVLVPLVTAAANVAAQRKRGLKKSLFTALVATVAVSILFLVALVVLGIPFHFSIGGTL